MGIPSKTNLLEVIPHGWEWRSVVACSRRVSKLCFQRKYVARSCREMRPTEQHRGVEDVLDEVQITTSITSMIEYDVWEE